MGKGKNKGRTKPPPRLTSYYPLAEVKALVQAERVVVRGNACESARQDFGWDTDDILDALLKLRKMDFYKLGQSQMKPHIVLDFYRANPLKGEAVYIHFYIDDEENMLIVNSFKKDTGIQ